MSSEILPCMLSVKLSAIYALTFTIIWANSTDNKLTIFFLFLK